MATFMEEYHAGRAKPEDIPKWISTWAAAPLGSPTSKLDLVEYLGMSHDDYGHWVSTGMLRQPRRF